MNLHISFRLFSRPYTRLLLEGSFGDIWATRTKWVSQAAGVLVWSISFL